MYFIFGASLSVRAGRVHTTLTHTVNIKIPAPSQIHFMSRSTAPRNSRQQRPAPKNHLSLSLYCFLFFSSLRAHSRSLRFQHLRPSTFIHISIKQRSRPWPNPPIMLVSPSPIVLKEFTTRAVEPCGGPVGAAVLQAKGRKRDFPGHEKNMPSECARLIKVARVNLWSLCRDAILTWQVCV
jgi:hypothetical protein